MPAKDGEFREWRRFQALHLKSQGWCRREVAETLSVTERSVNRWFTIARDRGPEGLLSAPIPGRPPDLSPQQLQRIPELLWHGAEAYGFRGDAWTCGRIAQVIEQEFGVSYDKGHVSRLLKLLRLTPQMPIERATQRDEQAIEHWRSQTWPRLLGESRTQRRTLVFADESGFYLLPSVMKTYAPRGQTPVLRAKLTRDHLLRRQSLRSVMGGMTPAGKRYTLARQESLNGLHSVEFLMHLMRLAGERLLVVWDGSPIHRRTLVREFVGRTREKVRLEALPAYAPDLNPWDEGGWHHLKTVEMRNLTCRDLEEFHEQFHLAVHRLRQKAVTRWTSMRALHASVTLGGQLYTGDYRTNRVWVSRIGSVARPHFSALTPSGLQAARKGVVATVTDTARGPRRAGPRGLGSVERRLGQAVMQDPAAQKLARQLFDHRAKATRAAIQRPPRRSPPHFSASSARTRHPGIRVGHSP